MPAANHWIVTAKFTEDGANAWRRADGSWARQIGESELLADEAAGKAIAATSAASEQRYITDPYVIEVYAADGAAGQTAGRTIDPLTARERIRANGPTVPLRRPDSGLPR